MANTAVKQASGPNFITYLLTGDGTVVGPTIASATLLADMDAGPLKDAFNAAYASQAAMRLVLVAGSSSAGCTMNVHPIVTVNDVTAQVNQISVDVDTDAVTPTKAEVNITMSDTTGQVAYLTIKHMHSIIR